MSAREDMLDAVRRARFATFGGSASPHPADTAGGMPRSVITRDAGEAEALVARFVAAAQTAAANVVQLRRAALPQVVATIAGRGGAIGGDSLSDAARESPRILSMVNEIPGNTAPPDDPRALASLDLFVCEGVLGVAESGAIWLPASRLGERAGLVLATEVVVVLERSAIVADMHEAYASVDVSAEDFGVFLAGPSKTADIEQSLVIGAHGAKGLTVALVDG